MYPDKEAWISDSDIRQPEWLQYDYGAGLKVRVSGVRAYVAYGRGGTFFQGSNDRTTWVTFGSWDSRKETFDGAPWPGIGSYADEFPASPEGYRYIRIYSADAPYLYYSWLQFFGVVVQ